MSYLHYEKGHKGYRKNFVCVSEDKNNRRREFNRLVVKPCTFHIDIRSLPILCLVVAGGWR